MKQQKHQRKLVERSRLFSFSANQKNLTQIMKKQIKYLLTIFLFLSVLSPSIYAQAKPPAINELKIIVDTLKVKKSIDTLKVQFLPQIKEKEQNDKPWQIALLVGILTFIATVFASLLNRRITLKSLVANKDIAIKQIENSQLVTLHQFNSTLKTKNRQEWVNELRNTMSEFMANCTKINVEFQDPSNDSRERIKDIHEKITLNRTKLRLLLDPEKDLHNKLLSSMSDFVNIIDEHVLNYRGNINHYKNFDFQKTSDTMIENARVLLYSEWQKIQKLTDDKKT